MKNSLVCKQDGITVGMIDSREVAEMLGREHWMVLRDIEGNNKVMGIIPTLADNNFVVSDYFVQSSYKDGSGKCNKCYLVTKMGCEVLGNKQQGEKGILFTVKYVKRFNEMEIGIQQLSIGKMIVELKREFTEVINDTKTKIEELAKQGKENHRPSHKTKLNWNNIIKQYAVCRGDEEVLKQMTLTQFGAIRWEDIAYDKKDEVVKYIRDTAKNMNMFVQEKLTI